jgi:hypothetical protein
VLARAAAASELVQRGHGRPAENRQAPRPAQGLACRPRSSGATGAHGRRHRADDEVPARPRPGCKKTRRRRRKHRLRMVLAGALFRNPERVGLARVSREV